MVKPRECFPEQELLLCWPEPFWGWWWPGGWQGLCGFPARVPRVAVQAQALPVPGVAVGAAGVTLAGQAAVRAELGGSAVCSTLGAGFARGAQAAPRGRVAGDIAGTVTEPLAPLAVRPFLAACVTALAPQPRGTLAAPGGRVTAGSVLAVTALPAALSVETCGTAVLAEGSVAASGTAAGPRGRVAGGVVQAGAAELAVGTVPSRRAF